MLECGLRAVVLHDKGVVWNYYAECTADSRRINTNRLKIKICTYSVACYVKQDGALPYRSDGIDLSKKADYPTGTVLIVPLAAYYLQKHAVMAITSNTWLNISGDNLTYTCAVAYFYI